VADPPGPALQMPVVETDKTEDSHDVVICSFRCSSRFMMPASIIQENPIPMAYAAHQGNGSHRPILIKDKSSMKWTPSAISVAPLVMVFRYLIQLLAICYLFRPKTRRHYPLRL